MILTTATSPDYRAIAQISIAAYSEYSQILSAENWQRMQQDLQDVEHTVTSRKIRMKRFR